MLLIISERGDISTSKVINWLKKYGVKYLRINDEDIKTIIFSEINNLNTDMKFSVNDETISLSEIDAVWYRRGEIRFNYDKVNLTNNESIQTLLNQHLLHEVSIVENFLRHLLRSKKCLGNFMSFRMNKLIVLHEAVKCGLKIPDSKILSASGIENANLNDFSYVVKAISEAVHFNLVNAGFVMNYTNRANLDMLKNRDFPSLLQNEIKKRYELRIFFLKDQFYSMAIFSQGSLQTSLDFRKYNAKNPSRTVPFKIPNLVEEKISRLMKVLGIDNGSIDMIVDQEGEFYFLEINPVGQYDMVSQPCNYNIDKIIADHLITLLN